MYRSHVPTLTVDSFGRRAQVVDFSRIVATPPPCEPNCAEKFGCNVCAENVTWWTPRNADLLHAAAEVLADEILDHTDGGDGELDTWILEELLPPVATRLATVEWVDRFVGCLRDLALRIEDGETPSPRCTGEEMALHLMLDRAYTQIVDPLVPTHYLDEVEATLPTADEDYAMHLLSEVLFEDHDVLMLFDASLDGIESDVIIGEQMGLSGLHPAQWFNAFREEFPVAPLEAGSQRPVAA